MARSGRKRKQGAREPSGRLKRVPQHDRAREQAAKQRSRYGLKHAELMDPRAGTAIGRAVLYGYITDVEREAGEEFARRWIRWAMLSGIPMPTAQALDYSREVRGGWGGAGPTDEAILKARRQFAEMQAPDVDFNLVRSVVVEDNDTGLWPCRQRERLARSLRRLVEIFGIHDPDAVVSVFRA